MRLRRFGYVILGGGIALLLEHAVTYGYSWEWSLECHGLYGLVLIVASFLILARRK